MAKERWYARRWSRCTPLPGHSSTRQATANWAASEERKQPFNPCGGGHRPTERTGCPPPQGGTARHDGRGHGLNARLASRRAAAPYASRATRFYITHRGFIRRGPNPAKRAGGARLIKCVMQTALRTTQFILSWPDCPAWGAAGHRGGGKHAPPPVLPPGKAAARGGSALPPQTRRRKLSKVACASPPHNVGGLAPATVSRTQLGRSGAERCTQSNSQHDGRAISAPNRSRDIYSDQSVCRQGLSTHPPEVGPQPSRKRTRRRIARRRRAREDPDSVPTRETRARGKPPHGRHTGTRTAPGPARPPAPPANARPKLYRDGSCNRQAPPS